MEKYIQLKNGTFMPRLGMGTWFLGEDLRTRENEKEALRAGIEAGMRLIDTAEMYGNGLSEQLIGQVIREYDRESLFVVSKVLPGNAGRKRIKKSLDQTLRLLRTDYLDLYLLHWPGSIPLEETVTCMEEFVAEGKIRAWGVSNFDTDEMKELMDVPGGERCAVNQVLYHLGSRGIEYDLLPWQEERQIPVMAYCPLAQAGSLRNDIINNKKLMYIAKKHGITVIQLMLAFVLRKDSVIAIPRSKKKEHVIENAKVWDITLNKEDMEIINEEFPAPERKIPLDIV